jgi:hypothetical protein
MADKWVGWVSGDYCGLSNDIAVGRRVTQQGCAPMTPDAIRESHRRHIPIKAQT